MSIDAEMLKERLQTRLASKVKVVDESHLHAGHAGAKSRGKHFHIEISSPHFQGLKTLAKHRLVYDALEDWMAREIHALSIQVVESD